MTASSPGGVIAAGSVYVVFGRQSGPGALPRNFDLALIADGDGTDGFVIHGYQESEQIGDGVASGDVNDDGIDDIIIGTKSAGQARGKAYVVYGRDALAGGFPAVSQLSSLVNGDGSTGFALDGFEPPGILNAPLHESDRYYSSGDINGDGIDDMIIGDGRGNPDGRNLAGVTYVVLGRPANTPGRPVLSIGNSPSAVEGDFLQFKVKLSEPASNNVTFNIRSIDDTATAPEDYDSKRGSRMLAAGQTERTIWVRTYDDGVIEENETMRLKLSNVKNADLGKASAIGTIIGNDDTSGLAKLSVADASGAEGRFARFIVSLSKPTNNDVMFSVRTYNGTAFAGGDFDAKTGTRTIPAGQTSKTIWVKLKKDNRKEGQEQFRLVVEVQSNNAVLGDGMATGTISDR